MIKLVMSVLAMSLFTTSCLALPESEPAGPPIPTPVSDSAAFRQALADIGLDVTDSISPEDPLFEAQAEVMHVNLEQIRVFQFETTEQRNGAATLIAPDASTIAGKQMVWKAEPTIWSSGRLIVIYDGLDGGLIQVISGILGDPITIQAPISDEPYPPALLMTMQKLATDLNLDPATIEVVSFEPSEWANSCLEIPNEGEECERRLTRGWLIHLQALDSSYRFHTDELGLEIRQTRVEE
jgi:hypothetical protein